MFLIDAHCHLLYQKFRDVLYTNYDEKCDGIFVEKYDIKNIIERAEKTNVNVMVVVGTELSDVDILKKISDENKNIFRTVGIHPLEAKSHVDKFSENEIIDIIKKHSAYSKTIAIGEIGLDYHYERDSIKEQKKLFDLQMNLAEEMNLPVEIHAREATNDIVDILRNHKNVRGMLHCFSGEKDFAKNVLDLGWYISISGVITYKKSTELQETVQKYIPHNRLLIETDAPFLSPVPYRGKINEPAYLFYTAEKISQLLDISIEKLQLLIKNNFEELFKINLDT